MEQQLREPQQPASVVTTPEENISPEEMAAYIDDRLSAEERATVEERLARSPELRAELVAATRLVSTPDESRARRPFIWRSATLLVTAAAAVALIAVLPRYRGFHHVPVPTERRADAEDGGRVRLLTPADAAVVPIAAARFSWHPEGDASYRITIADASGATVWTTLTSDTTVTLPSAMSLRPGNHYYWYVDALRADGSSVTSGSQSFTTNPR